jgi:hypothetical protein
MTLIMAPRRGQQRKIARKVPAPVRAALAEWLEIRGTEPGPLFTNLDRAHPRRRLSGHGIWEALRAYGEKAGVRASPNRLRHAGITRRLEEANGEVVAARETRAARKRKRHFYI